MTVISLRRRTHESQLKRARLETLTDVRQAALAKNRDRANAASTRVEAAAARVLESHERLLRGG